MLIKSFAKDAVNALCALVGARMVNRHWGPCGHLATLERVKRRGVVPARVLDAGASDGKWTLSVNKVLPHAAFLLVDPLEENRPALEELSNRSPNIKFWQGALGEAPATRQLYIHGDQTSFFESQYSEQAGETRDVPVQTMDHVVTATNFGPPDFIKADVQGFEREILQGAESCLQSAELLLLEVSFQQIYQDSPLAHDVISFVGDRGFQILDIATFAQRSYDHTLLQSDIFFAKRSSKLFSDTKCA